MFQKVLIANRGEIALRILRACKELGIQTVAVHSVADANAMHVRLADESVCIGPNPAKDSYLNIPSILAACEITGADAVHPGYGFLSENARFARILTEHKITFIGPSSHHIEIMGDKITAKKTAVELGIPVVPGSEGEITTAEDAMALANDIGYPVIVKATAGGGGRGMKVARNDEEMRIAISTARSEAKAAFGNASVYIEKYLEKPRHIEVQVLGDGQGNAVHLGTRDCSLQRRHQKLVEEAPAPFLSAAQFDLLYTSSKAILREVGYVGAGTCEFLVASDGTISFLEVNTRLQVEHPVSEEVTGIDLVREQFRIAEGGTLDYDDPEPQGHSFEFRINGEDPGLNFMPTPGPVNVLRFPGGPGVRVDSGVTTGDVIGGAFDSLLAKLIVTGASREDALERSRRALDEFEVAGLPTVLPFHRRIVRDPAFTSEPFSIYTRWIETDFDNDIEPWTGSLPDAAPSSSRQNVVVEVGGKRIEVSLPARMLGSAASAAAVVPPRRSAGSAVATATGNSVKAPMQATIVKLAVADGDRVVKGDLVLVLEAMKMEQPLTAHKDGTVADINAAVGATVSSGHLLLNIVD